MSQEENTKQNNPAPFTIEIAGVNVGIEPQKWLIRNDCKNYITDGEPEFCVSLGQEDMESERQNIAFLPGFNNISDGMLERYTLHRKITEALIDYDTILIHAVASMVDGKCFLFTGPSGAGKTTHAKLWQQVLGDGVVTINDDKPFIRVFDDEIRIYGSPWCGKERLNTNTSAPLAGIAVIKQSKENRVTAIPKNKAFEKLVQQIYRSREPQMTRKVLGLIDRIAMEIPVYLVECDKTPEAARRAYDTMIGHRMPDGEAKKLT